MKALDFKGVLAIGEFSGVPDHAQIHIGPEAASTKGVVTDRHFARPKRSADRLSRTNTSIHE